MFIARRSNVAGALVRAFTTLRKPFYSEILSTRVLNHTPNTTTWVAPRRFMGIFDSLQNKVQESLAENRTQAMFKSWDEFRSMMEAKEELTFERLYENYKVG